jgi:hypothetical protein
MTSSRAVLLFLGACLIATPLASAPARAQGAIIESLADLADRPDAPAFRATLPPRVDLSATLPPPRDQGPTGSCTSWAVTYAAGSQAARRAGLGATLRLAPAFTYNKIVQDSLCNIGTNASTTLDLLRNVGALPMEEFVFDGGWCGRQATSAELERAARYRIHGWSKLDATKVETVKAQLARGVVVVFDIQTNQAFKDFKGDAVFDAPGVLNGGGHSMTAIGYDDARQAFRIQNSWGRKWADGGYGWLSYGFWTRNTGVGYVID